MSTAFQAFKMELLDIYSFYCHRRRRKRFVSCPLSLWHFDLTRVLNNLHTALCRNVILRRRSGESRTIAI